MTRRASGSFQNGASNILKTCTEEFKDCDLQDIAQRYIQGEPSISRIAVEPEAILPRIESEQTEDKSEAEGTVYYDIRFHAVAPVDGKLIQLIINLEAQNDFNPGYPLLKRAVYYCGRMISSQYGTVFVKSHYEKIQKVYSIWICTMPMKKWEYNISSYQLTEKHLIGHTQAEKEPLRFNQYRPGLFGKQELSASERHLAVAEYVALG